LKETITDVFFDLDHTLWDFEKNSALTFERILKENNIDVSLDDFLTIYIPLNYSYWKLYREEKISKEELRYGRLKNTFETLTYKIEDEQINALALDYIKHLSNQNFLFNNTREILEYLKIKYRLHIITNGFEEVQEKKLINAKIHSFFNHIINSEMVGVKKPNPIIFEFALKKANVQAKHSIMIGDSLEADVIGALEVGMHAIHFNSAKGKLHNHAAIIHDLIEIKQFL